MARNISVSLISREDPSAGEPRREWTRALPPKRIPAAMAANAAIRRGGRERPGKLREERGAGEEDSVLGFEGRELRSSGWATSSILFGGAPRAFRRPVLQHSAHAAGT